MSMMFSVPFDGLSRQGGDPSGLFQHVGTFDVMAGNGSVVAEIVDVTINGKQLVYTDSPGKAIGFVDISDPASPVVRINALA